MNTDTTESTAAAQSTVLVVEDDPDLRELVGMLVEAECHAAWLGAGSYDELVELGERALLASVAILDVNLGPTSASGLTAYRWLRDNGFHGRVIFLTGHGRSHPEVEQARQVEGARVLQKPVEAADLAAVVAEEERLR